MLQQVQSQHFQALPELGQVQDIFVSRVPAMGRDPGVGYFYIAFN
ncbi:hypothetical protein [Pseudomonas sp. ZB1P45]